MVTAGSVEISKHFYRPRVGAIKIKRFKKEGKFLPLEQDLHDKAPVIQVCPPRVTCRNNLTRVMVVFMGNQRGGECLCK